VSDASDVLTPGAKAGPWIVEREIGRGGMGAVYAVVHEEIGKRAALKVVHSRLTPSFNPDRMLIEARVVNQIGHPNIVDIFETGKLPDGRPYIVMERLEGQSLAYRADDGKLLPDLVISILLQVCDALIAAHTSGVIHRDLKLDNVFLIDNPDEPSVPRVKLLDWGIAKVIHQNVRHTVDGQLVGTPQYLAPEQARGAAVSPATDVYSLGVMAYELFLEQLPFEAETSAEIMAMHLRAAPPPPSDLWPDIPVELEQLLLAMLAKSPDARPSMLEVAHRLETARAAFDERRRHITNPPAVPVPVAAIGSSRRLSPIGRAPTLPAERPALRRWRYAAGAAALAASAGLFAFTRAGDRPAAAAAAAAVITAPANAAPTAVLEIDNAIDRAIESEPLAAAPTPADTEATDSIAPTPAPLHAAGAATAPTPPVKRAVRRATPPPPRNAPVAPRRAVKIDPDGTIDPYR